MNKKNNCLKIILIPVATLLMGLVLTSCKKEPRNLYPIDTIRNLAAAIQTEDVNSFLTCYDQVICSKLQEQMEDVKKFWPTYCKVMSRVDIEDVQQEVTGERASVIVTFTDEGIKRQYELHREGERWVVSSPPPLASVDFLTQELEIRAKKLAEKEITPASTASDLPMSMIREHARFANEYPNLFSAVKLFQNLVPKVPDPHLIISSEENGGGAEISSTVTVPAGHTAEGVVKLLDVWMGDSVTVKLVTEKEEAFSFVNIPDGFDILLMDTERLPSALIDDLQVKYLVRTESSVKPGTYDVNFGLKILLSSEHIYLKVNVTESRPLNTLEQLAASYWKLFKAFAESDNYSNQILEQIKKFGPSQINRKLDRRFRSKMSSMTKNIISIKRYCDAARYAKNRDVRMAAELFQYLQYTESHKSRELQLKSDQKQGKN